MGKFQPKPSEKYSSMKKLAAILNEHHVTCDLLSLERGERTLLTVVFSGDRASAGSVPKTEKLLFVPDTEVSAQGTYYNGSLGDGRRASLHRNGSSLFLYVEKCEVPVDPTMPLNLCLAAG